MTGMRLAHSASSALRTTHIVTSPSRRNPSMPSRVSGVSDDEPDVGADAVDLRRGMGQLLDLHVVEQLNACCRRRRLRTDGQGEFIACVCRHERAGGHRAIGLALFSPLLFLPCTLATTRQYTLSLLVFLVPAVVASLWLIRQ